MANGEFVYFDGYFSVNSVVLSDHTRGVNMNGVADTLDKTAFGQYARTFLQGLMNHTVAPEFNDDLAAGSVDATIFAAYKARVAVPIAFRASDDAIAANNPEYQANCLINQWNIGGNIGALASKSLSWQIDGDVTRDVTP